ncbi:MAG: hypothetical protein JWP54_3442, partial [Cryobacterium sp.]|nr:hypothetical protein [Cryobacterium sp.]
MTDGGGTGGSGAANRELTISGGGSTQVATDVVFVQVATLRLVQGEAEGWQEQLGQVRSIGTGPVHGWQPDDLAACVFAAFAAITTIAQDSRELADRLVEAAEEYGRLEANLDLTLRRTGSWLGHALGALRPLAALAALALAAPLAYLAVGSLISNAILGRGVSVVPPVLADWLRENRGLLTDPATVALVRVLVASADDAALGGMGVPYPVAAALGDDGAGLFGAPSSAFGLLIAARAAGMLRETPVRVHRVGGSAVPRPAPGLLSMPRRDRAATPAPASVPAPASTSALPSAPVLSPRSAPEPAAAGGSPAAAGAGTALAAPNPPTGFADLAERIPTADDGGQVRIERYGDAEHPSWLVYIGGTVEWSPAGSTEPWDMTSNVTAVADQEAGSYQAVLQALQLAGVQPGDPVLPVAHSQGGLIAAELAARGDVNAVGMVTFGAPAGQVALPAEVPAIAVEHSDDIVPALGGTPAEDDRRLYVRRQLFVDTAVPVAEPLPAHQLAGYRETAGLVDASAEPRLVAFREQLGAIVGTTPGEQSVWRA